MIGNTWHWSLQTEMINLLYCLESFQAKVKEKDTQKESGSLSGLKKSLEKWRWIEFMGQTTGEEGATFRRFSGDPQRAPLESSAELWSAHVHKENYWRSGKDH